jgi:transcriptional regulator with XRE-family HTH domain
VAATFAEKLRKLLRERKLTQTDLSKLTGIDRVDLNRMVNGRREPKAHEVAMLSIALSVSSDELASAASDAEVRVYSVIARRVLDAEAALRQLQAEIVARESGYRAAEERWARERMELIGEKEAARRRAAEIESGAATREARMELRMRELTANLAQRSDEIHRLRFSLKTQAESMASLQAERAKDSGHVLFAGIIGALAGAAIGKSR